MTTDKNIESIYLLSPMQEGMLFHTLYAPKSSVYFEQFSCTLQGNINRNAFKQAWQHVVDRHPVLRTLVIWKKGNKPRQLVRKRVKLPWLEHDWRGLTSTVCQARLETFLKEDRELGFVLDKAPLMRCALIQIADDTYYFVRGYHHLLMDGWSSALLFKEVFTCYKDFCQRQEAYLPKPRPYRDYIAWLHQQDLSQAEAFWKEQLTGFPAPTPFRVDKLVEKSSPTEETYEEQTLSLEPNTTQALLSLAKTHHLTLNTLVQGAWALLLSRYSGDNDIVFGATVSGRPATLAGVESIVGLFINTLPVRVSVSTQQLLLPWLKELHTKQQQRELYSYTPLVDIQGWSEIPGGISLFDSILVFENYPIDKSLNEEAIGTLSISEVQSLETTNYPLTLGVVVNTNQLKLIMSYTVSRFEADTVSRMMGHLKTLLEGMITQPETRKLGEIPLLTEAEQQQLLAWNETAANYPRGNKTLVALFEEQVDKAPEAIAIVFEEQLMTYRELNTKANQLAHYLQSLGVKPEVLVGICVERSLEMIIGILGILKAGGAYVPLDPAYPAARLTFMLEDAQVPVLLTQSHLKAQLPNTTAQVINLDAEAFSLSSTDNPSSEVGPDNLAYVIYTSGSTGKPKGVMIEHHAIADHCRVFQSYYQLVSSDRVLQFASLSFDSSVEEIFSTLTAGARLIVRGNTVWTITDFSQKVIENGMTVVDIPVAYWQQWLRETVQLPDSVLNNSLKLVGVGGDMMRPEMLHLWWQTPMNSIRLINAYGPTEATVTTTAFEITSQFNKGTPHQKIPIGRPLANKMVYILDTYNNPVPIGVPSELHIGGTGLARGYLNRPELTAEKFIKNPFSDDPDARLYKTGDLARYLPDSNIEFLGRVDNQIKIRGFRVELGEIEKVLAQHPLIRENVVIVHEVSQTDKRLVAYIVPNKGQLIENTELSSFMSERLPDYMIPSAWVTLEALPLTPTGKIDRRALSQLSIEQLSSEERSLVAPRDALEFELAQIWEDILNIRPIGMHDNFFELGGHSLLAISLMTQIGTHFGKHLPLATLFQGATIEQLANLLRQQSDQSAWSSLVAIQPNGSKPPFFCMPGGGGNVIYFYELARLLGQDQPFYGLQAIGLDGENEPQKRVEDIAAHYIKEIQTIQKTGPYLLGGHSFGGHVAFEMSQQLQKQGQEVALVVILDTLAPNPYDEPLGLDWDNTRWLTFSTEVLGQVLGKELDVTYDALEPLTAAEQLNYVKERLVTANWLPPGTDIKQLRGYLEVFKANNQTVYYPENIVKAPRISLLKAKEQPNQSQAKEWRLKMLKESTWGWSPFSESPVDVRVVPGEHRTMMNPPYVQVLAEQLKDCLEQALAVRGHSISSEA